MISSSFQQLLSMSHCSPSVLVDEYNNTLTSIMDEVAPPTTKTFRGKVRAPWFNEKLLEARRSLRQKERRWRKSGLIVHEQIFKSARRSYVTKLRDAHAAYHRDRIVGADARTLFRVIDEITGTKQATQTVTPDLDLVSLPQLFVEFFHRKIQSIQEGLPSPSILPLNHVLDNDFCLSSFELVSEHFVARLINTLPPK